MHSADADSIEVISEPIATLTVCMYLFVYIS